MQYNITYRKKDNGWQYIISYKDENGKWKQKSKQGFALGSGKKIPQEVKDASLEALEELKEKITFSYNKENEGITFKEYADKFINHEQIYKEASTIDSYKIALKKFKGIHNLMISEIENIHIQECVDDLIREGLNGRSIKKYYTTMRLFINAAVEDKTLLKTPIEKIIIPAEKKPTVKKALTSAELDDLLSKIKNKNQYIISLLAGTCGLRRGEILGLTWNDIDFNNLTININKQFKLSGDRDAETGDLKSKNSNRIVPISPQTANKLIEFKDSKPMRMDRKLFSYKSPISVSSNLIKLYKDIGYDISLHELRHTYATMLISNGIDIKTAAEFLGHDVELTYKTYSHVTDEMKKKASQKIKEIFNF